MNDPKVETLTEVEVPDQRDYPLPPMPRYIVISLYAPRRGNPYWTAEGPFHTPDDAVFEARLGGHTIESTIRVFEIPEAK